MLKIEDIKVYDITTPVEKKHAGVNSTSNDAYTWVSGKPFEVVAPYVYQGGDGVMLWAPTTGATTSSVKRTRCELKGKPFYFKDQAYHETHMTCKFHKVNWYGSVVFMQMHCHDGNDPTNKTFFVVKEDGKGQILNGLRITKSSSDPKKVLLLDNIDLSKPFSVKYTTTKEGFFTIDAQQGENVGHLEAQIDSTRSARPHVYHWGVYNQIDEGNVSEPIYDGSLVELIELSEYHGDVILPPVEPPLEDPYVATQARIDQLQDKYYKELKILQTAIKTELNILTTDMKQLTDKTKTASMYTEITGFKANMAQGLVRKTE